MPGTSYRRRHVEKFHLQPIERLRQDTRKSVWYAFDTLAHESTGKAAKSQLKVLTSTIGMVLGFDKSEEILNKDQSTNELEFLEYLKVLENEIFDKLSDSTMENLKLSNDDLESVHKNCWLLFLKLKKDPRGSSEHLKMLPENISFHLWRVFNFLAEEGENEIPLLPLQLDLEEAEILLNCFVEMSGQVMLLSEVKSYLKSFEEQGYLGFQQLECAITYKFSENMTEQSLKKVIKEIFEKFIGDTLMKGMLCKCGHGYKSWKDRWMVLTSRELMYYTSAEERVRKGTIDLNHTCKVEIAPDKSGAKPNRFIVRTSSKPYEMSANDIKSRNDWMAAIQKVIDKSEDCHFHFHRNEVTGRRQKRISQRKQKEDEERRKLAEEEKIKQMMDKFSHKIKEDEEKLLEQSQDLEKSRLAQQELEEKLRREEALRKELERLLELERQAKRDEEIVRALQARILQEEYEKREELERLKAEKEELLKAEMEKREGLEGQKDEQLRKLQEAQERLRQLETERETAETKLTEASGKLHLAEKERRKMEEQLKLWKTPTGLARPILPKETPLVTHRGLGSLPKVPVTQNKIQLEAENKQELNKTEGSVDNKTRESTNSEETDGRLKHENSTLHEEETKEKVNIDISENETQANEKSSVSDEKTTKEILYCVTGTENEHSPITKQSETTEIIKEPGYQSENIENESKHLHTTSKTIINDSNDQIADIGETATTCQKFATNCDNSTWNSSDNISKEQENESTFTPAYGSTETSKMSGDHIKNIENKSESIDVTCETDVSENSDMVETIIVCDGKAEIAQVSIISGDEIESDETVNESIDKESIVLSVDKTEH